MVVMAVVTVAASLAICTDANHSSVFTPKARSKKTALSAVFLLG
jgi:hypothetical protein